LLPHILTHSSMCRPTRPMRWGIMLRGLLARIVGVCA
jgi:hypothetical protein